jgi:UDP-2,3-diacylglucosamine pyrophosphatase LpxH
MKSTTGFYMMVLCTLVAWLPTSVVAKECPAGTSAGTQRQLVVISDLHFGVGKQADGSWDPTEDFRWSHALDAFLHKISDCGKDAVDLVIAGDAFELWQPPKELECKGATSDAGCTTTELRLILANVISAHRKDLEALGAFADRGTNFLYFVPGNHDSALVLDDCWQLVVEAVSAKRGRLKRVPSGIWVSGDGRVVIEHGHQIGEDVNKYPEWPTITTNIDGILYVHRPWGERFVQVLFNEEEKSYPTIDNLSPESAGVRYRMADKGLWRSVADVARFLQFNLFETAMSQKLQVLGADADPSSIPSWDLNVARGWGHLLFARALAEDDPFRKALMSDKDDDARQLRGALDNMARDPQLVSDVAVRQLCDLVAIQSKGNTRCLKVQLGAGVEALLISKRSVMIEHLRSRMRDPLLRGMRVFVYAHTHLLEEPWSLKIPGSSDVVIVNTGAFQRVVDESGFLSRANAKGLTPAEALRRLTVENLAPCYTAVAVPLVEGLLEPVLVRWHMDENEAGEFLGADAPLCQ